DPNRRAVGSIILRCSNSVTVLPTSTRLSHSLSVRPDVAVCINACGPYAPQDTQFGSGRPRRTVHTRVMFSSTLRHPQSTREMGRAEGEGFEPPRALRPYRFSRPALSTAQPSLLNKRFQHAGAKKDENTIYALRVYPPNGTKV